MSEEATVNAGKLATDELLKDTEELLDEIDALLEESGLIAADYIQRGGE